LQRVEVVVHRRGGGESDGVADFSNRGRESPFGHARLDAFENAALTFGEGGIGHGWSVRMFAPIVKHVFGRASGRPHSWVSVGKTLTPNTRSLTLTVTEHTF